MDGPHKFRVKFEIGYKVPSRELVPRSVEETSGADEVEVREVDVLAYDAKQAVYQVQIGLNKEVLLSVRDVPGTKPLAFAVRQRKQHFILSVEPVLGIGHVGDATARIDLVGKVVFEKGRPSSRNGTTWLVRGGEQILVDAIFDRLDDQEVRVVVERLKK